jgi:hypothetical protein
VRAYTFEWDGPNLPFCGSAVVAAGNVAGARIALTRYQRRKGYEVRQASEVLSSPPGPYWSVRAKNLTRPRVLYYNDGAGSRRTALTRCRA